MNLTKDRGILISGILAGIINGLLGAGGGMILIPLLGLCSDLNEDILFPCSLAMMLPMCITSLLVRAYQAEIYLELALPYMFGSTIGGFVSGKISNKIPTVWLHRILGVFILWGGIQFLWKYK